MIRVAIVHYHLRRGGVTRVIENALEALAGTDVDIFILTGEAPEDASRLKGTPFNVLPELGYCEQTEPGGREKLADAMSRACDSHWGSLPDLWHWHNASLGKNVHVCGAIRHLSHQNNAAFLLQIHDFAEDGRPSNYARIQMAGDPIYPRGRRIAYAVINGRDYARLTRCGWKDDDLFLLPNAVSIGSFPVASPSDSTGQKLILYPTRAIRRKNIGEMVLHSIASGPDTCFASTLAPANPAWLPAYRDWVTFSKSRHLPVRFGVGESGERSFPEWIGSAHVLLTTSIAEGFGLAFLEPFLMGRGIRGRNLADITGDFVREGVRLDDLYDELRVPGSLLGDDSWQRDLRASMEQSYRLYGRTCEDADFETARDSIETANGLEFGRLSEEHQRKIISAILDSPQLRKETELPSIDHPVDAGIVQSNREAIEERFSIHSYRKRLLGIYEGILNRDAGEPEDAFDAEAVLDEFLDPRQYNLLRD